MSNPVGERVFRAPGGRADGLRYLTLGTTALAAYGYMAWRYGTYSSALIALPVAFALLGVAEVLPAERTRAAGVLRVVALVAGIAIVLG